MGDPGNWLLTDEERGNPATRIPPWTTGNLARPLVLGDAYFDRLVEEDEALGAGDHLFFTDWLVDPEERLRPDGPIVADLFTHALKLVLCMLVLVLLSHW